MGKLYLNFRDETVWRGRMLSHVHATRSALYEIGGLFAAIVLVYQWTQEQAWVIGVAAAASVRMFGPLGTVGSWSGALRKRFQIL